MSEEIKLPERKTMRYKGYDYTQNGFYFITISTKNMEIMFGRITNEDIILSEIGKIAQTCWKMIPEKFPNTILHDFVIMPNHIHGVIEIFYSLEDLYENKIGQHKCVRTSEEGGLHKCVRTGEEGGLHKCVRTGNPMQEESLFKIIRWFKGRTTYECRKHQYQFDWHSRFYDRIIRNDDEHFRISEYIRYNPIKWSEDEFYRQ